MASIYNFLLRLDGVIYDLIDYLYDIFNYLAKLNLFSNEDYTKIVSRIYIVLGMIMLFVLAYSLLRAVINPDDFAKGEHSFPKLIQNIIVSLIIIAVLPTVFTVAFNIQNSILNNDTIPKLILGTDGYDETMKSDAGRSMAYYTFKAFFHPNEEWCISKGYISGAGATDAELLTCSEKIKGNGWIGLQNGDPLSTVDEPIRTGERSFIGYNQFGEAVEEGEITYYCLISSVAGIFLLYVLLNFCFDMAVRVVKLMFFQIIAPIPVVCRVIPFGGMKDVFSKWTKNTVSTFVEVFIRIAIMYLGVFLITDIVIPNLGPALAVSGLSFSQRLIVQALVIMGVIIFVKQAPKLIGDMFGLDSGSMKLGLMDKLAMGGGLMAGAAAGGLATSFARNAVSGVRNTKKKFSEARGIKGKAGALLSGAAWTGVSSIAGGVSGGARGLYGAKGAKNIGDMKSAASKAAAEAGKAKSKRDAYRASHQGVNAFDTLLQVGVGHGSDAFSSFKEYVGIGNLDDLNHEKAVADEMQGFYKTMASYVEDNEMVANYAGLYEAEKKREISNTTVDSLRYNQAVAAKVAAMRNDSRYSGMSDSDLYTLAGSSTDISQFTRQRTAQEMADAIQERQDNLKRLDNLKKIATIKAVNEKLNKKDADGNIIDGRFAAIANQVEVFKKQNAGYDFVNDMHLISGVEWQSDWDDIMRSGDNNRINDFVDQLKSAGSPVSFFGDSEQAKNHSGSVQAEIAKKIQEKKQQDGK